MFLPFAAAVLSAAAVWEVSLPPAPGVPCSFLKLCPEKELLPGFHSTLCPLTCSAAGSAAETSWSTPAADDTAVKHKHTNVLRHFIVQQLWPSVWEDAHLFSSIKILLLSPLLFLLLPALFLPPFPLLFFTLHPEFSFTPLLLDLTHGRHMLNLKWSLHIQH